MGRHCGSLGGSCARRVARSFLAVPKESAPRPVEEKGAWRALVQWPFALPNPNRWTPIKWRGEVRWQTKTFCCGRCPTLWRGEQAVLGSMLIDADCVKDVMDKLRPSDFYLRQNREIFETIYSMFTYAKPIDGITVCEEMQKAGTYDENTTRSYLAQLMEITPHQRQRDGVCGHRSGQRRCCGAWPRRRGDHRHGAGGRGRGRRNSGGGEQKVYAVRRGQSAQDMVPLRQVLPEVLDRLGEMSESENHLPGLSTGMSAVDQKITGLNKSDLILLAARPGMGKTSFALNVALNVAKAVHKTVAVFSLEMSREQLATRLLASEALVENNRLKTGALRETDWEKIAAPPPS